MAKKRAAKKVAKTPVTLGRATQMVPDKSWSVWYSTNDDGKDLEELRAYGTKTTCRLSKREFFTSAALRFALAEIASNRTQMELADIRKAAALAVLIADAVLKELGDKQPPV